MSGAGSTPTFGAYMTLGDTQYTPGSPFNLAAAVKTVVPNNAQMDPVNSRFNMREGAWDPVHSRFNPEFQNAVYSVRLSFLCDPGPGLPLQRWLQASLETPSVVAVVDTRVLTQNHPAVGQAVVFTWLVPIPTEQIVADGAKFFLFANAPLPIYNIRTAFFRVGG